MIWITADTHFRFQKILRITERGKYFNTIEEHDKHIADNIARCCDWEKLDNDELFIVGDIGDYTVSKTPCCLIKGNHDEEAGYYDEGWVHYKENFFFEHKGYKFYLAHLPHAYWLKSFEGSFHLYGHTHEQREKTLDLAFPGRRSMDVGLDNAKKILGEYRPFSIDEIIDILKDRPGHDDINFYHNYLEEQNES